MTSAPCGCIPGRKICDELNELWKTYINARSKAGEEKAMARIEEHRRQAKNEIARLNCQTCYEDDEGNVVSSEDRFP